MEDTEAADMLIPGWPPATRISESSGENHRWRACQSFESIGPRCDCRRRYHHSSLPSFHFLLTGLDRVWTTAQLEFMRGSEFRKGTKMDIRPFSTGQRMNSRLMTRARAARAGRPPAWAMPFLLLVRTLKPIRVGGRPAAGPAPNSFGGTRQVLLEAFFPFGKKLPSAMMFLLLLDVVDDSIQVPAAHREGAIAALPFEEAVRLDGFVGEA